MNSIRNELEKRIKNSMWILVIIMGMMSVVRLFFILNIFPEPVEENFFTGAMDGLLIGFHIGLIVVISIGIIKLKKSLKDEEKMKNYYIFITDERNILIKTKSAVPLNIINAYLFIIVAYLMQSISIYISLTCVIISFYLIIQSIILKLYYTKTM